MFKHHTDPYMNDAWLSQVKEMYDDEVIYYSHIKAKGFKKVFKKLKKKTDINFKKTKDLDKAEIICSYEEQSVPTAGRVKRCDGYFEVTVDPEFAKYKGKRYVESHEIGHALGLQHDPGYYSAMQLWGDHPHFFTSGDYSSINALFI